MRVLVVGWFSFEHCGATAGDIMSRDVVCRWLREAAVAFDIATAPPFADGVDWQAVRPERYTHVVFICGPFGNGSPITELLARFAHCALLGVNVSMLDALENWNPFEALWERDSSRDRRPDLSLLAEQPRVPVIGLILAHRQKEYGQRARHDVVEKVIREVLAQRDAAVLPIDTCLEANANGLTSPAAIEALIGKADVVVTTRLHGTVLALGQGVPAVAVDPIAGGAKIHAQCRSLDWPYCLLADDVDAAGLADALDACLAPAARERALACRDRAVERLRPIRDEFLGALKRSARAVRS